MDIKKEKSNIVVRSVEIRDGKEIVVEETLDNIQSDVPLATDEEIGELFDELFPEEGKE